jgi:hypothetical protein
MEIAWPDGSSVWEIQSATVNPRVTPQDFIATPPSGYFVAIDGKPQVISGGSTARDDRVGESIAEAKRLLGVIDPPRSSTRMWIGWPIVLGVCAILVLASVMLYKWRMV